MKKHRKKKILFNTSSLRAGGAERFMSGFIHYAVNRGIEAVCLTHNPDCFFPVPPSTKVIRRHDKDSLKTIHAIKDVIEQETPDAVFSILMNTEVAIAVLMAGARYRLVLAQPSHPTKEMSMLAVKRVDHRKLEKAIQDFYPTVDSVIAVSEDVKRSLVRNLMLPPEKIEVIHNGVDLREIASLKEEEIDEHEWFSEDVPIILNVASLVPVKGHRYLLESFQLARKKRLCRLVLIGDGRAKGELRKLARKLGVADSVLFLGLQKNPFKFMAQSSIFVLSSILEGCPTVLIEAKACGLPVITTDYGGGACELVKNGRNGFIVPVGDPGKMARVIVSLLDDKKLAGKMAAEGRRGLSEFSSERVFSRYLKIVLGKPV